MRRIGEVSKGLWSCAVVVLLAGVASAGERPLSIAGLAMASNAIVIGQVDSIGASRDPITGGIYTYVTLQTSEIWKGSLELGPITIKQLGGRLDDQGLMVPGQATFAVGEHVLVFLEARPRDRTLYTSGLWQGKWSIGIDPATNEQMAFKREPDSGIVTAGGPLSVVRREVSRVAALGSATPDDLNIAPIEQPAYAAAPFGTERSADSLDRTSRHGQHRNRIADRTAEWRRPGGQLGDCAVERGRQRDQVDRRLARGAAVPRQCRIRRHPHHVQRPLQRDQQ